MKLSKRIYSAQALKSKEGNKVILAGWVDKIKFMGKLAFITLRDREGKIQLTFLEKVFGKIESLNKITIESIISIEGTVKKSKLNSGDNEVIVKNLEVINLAKTPLPISFSDKNIDTEFSKRLDNRFLDLRDLKQIAIFNIRKEIFSSIRSFFNKENFIEISTPRISGEAAEGGADLFPLNYFGKKAYLSQSQQLYKQMMMAAGFEKVFEIGPSFRAEKSHTIRHVSEFSQLDVEMSFIDSYEDVMKIQEKLIVFVLNEVRKNCKKELDILERELSIPKLPFIRLNYETAINLLKEKGIKIKMGNEIDLEKEKTLGDIIRKKHNTSLYFLVNIPRKESKFYWMMNKEFGLGGDLEYEGQEIITGSQREHRYDVLVKQIKEKDMNPKNFEEYLKPFRYGMPSHGGFGLGIDRLTMIICGLGNIREAILFPRDTERLTP